ncbi:protein of unknown function [Bradyrhizobium vignae]|uniref:Uncharacterized protein n=1 Tax=Bradyrhizobium vignae TaxID=1549949 RepID=A0A2U3PVU4_9BRAD|nr:protein of unknown function [Bradyrhizobium vignae]
MSLGQSYQASISADRKVAERVGLSSSQRRVCEYRRKTRIPGRPAEACDHRCVPPVRPGGRSISGDFEGYQAPVELGSSRGAGLPRGFVSRFPGRTGCR